MLRSISTIPFILYIVFASCSDVAAQGAEDLLNQKARSSLGQDYSMAMNLADTALEIAKKSGNLFAETEAAAIKSRILSATSRCREANTLLYKLLGRVKAAKEASLERDLYIALGQCSFYQGKYDSSKLWFEQAAKLCSIQELAAPCSEAQLWLGKVFIKKGSPERASQLQQEAMTILSKTRHKEGLAWAKDLEGEVFYSQRLYEKAKESQLQSYYQFNRIRNLYGAATAMLHIGNAYYMQGKDDSAFASYQVSLSKYTTLGDSNGVAICFSNLSRVMLDKGDIASSITYAQKALGTIRSGSYPLIEAGTYQQLGDIYGEMGALDRAIVQIQQALQVARTGGYLVIVKDCYKSLSEIYQAMGKHDLAMNSLLAAYRLKDSVQPVAFTKRLAEMEAKYESDKKTAEIDALRQQEQIARLTLAEQAASLQKQRYLVLLLVVVIISIVSIWYYHKTRTKLREQIRQQQIVRDTEEKERQRIAKDIHDELGSGLSKIRFLAELAYSHPVNNPQLTGAIHSISDTSKVLVENMRDLVWAMNPENTTLDNLVARIREYSYEYLEELPVQISYDFPEAVPNVKISKEVNRNINMIVKETLQNIVKHAAATEVKIKLRLEPAFRIEITDNGKGFDVTLASEGNGLKNIASRSKALGARLELTSQPGRGSGVLLELDRLQIS